MLTTEQVCAELNCCRQTVYKMVREGHLIAYKIGNGKRGRGKFRFDEKNLSSQMARAEPTPVAKRARASETMSKRESREILRRLIPGLK